MGIARGRRRGKKFVNFTITAELAFNRRGFVVRRRERANLGEYFFNFDSEE